MKADLVALIAHNFVSLAEIVVSNEDKLKGTVVHSFIKGVKTFSEDITQNMSDLQSAQSALEFAFDKKEKGGRNDEESVSSDNIASGLAR